MPRYRMSIAYDGTDFHGWQKQRSSPLDPLDAAATTASEVTGPPHLRTVQDVVERAVREAVREPISLIGASRTDAGVHARAQTGAFTTSDTRRTGAPDERLVMAINARLPDDVIVRSCVRTRDDFQPITDCVAKGYRYTIHCGSERPLWDRRYVTHIWHALDEGAMNAAAGLLVGEHDFGAFATTGHGRLTTVRTVLSCAVSRPDSQRVHIEVSATGFLWNMVRIIAGTLVEVGRGRLSEADIREALATGNRRKAGPTLPPQGLCLMWSRYPEDAAPTSHDLDGAGPDLPRAGA